MTDLIYSSEKRSGILPPIVRIAVFWLVLYGAFQPVFAESLPAPDDIRLLSVCAVNANLVWAVGEMGVVRATSDGGKTWEIQFLPKSTSIIPPQLTDVFFLNSKQGWIVGKRYGYGRQGAFGVIYQTRDGGKTWFALDERFPNPLRCVRFLDGNRGVVAGQPTEANSSGIFFTSDSGKTWIPMGLTVDSIAQSWIDLVYDPQQGFALSSQNGALAAIKSLETAVQAKGLFHGNYLAALASVDSTFSLIANPADTEKAEKNQTIFGVGRAGMVLKSPDFGVSWNWLDLPQAAAGFDFQAASVAGDKLFVAGRPGNRLFVGNLKEQTWSAVPLPDPVIINDFSFSDACHGWAVGALGRIVATADAGQTWSVQLSGGKRSAILAIFPSINQIPWEILASFATQQRAIVVLEIVGAQPILLDPCRPSDAELLQSAALRCGVSETRLWTGFPLAETSSSSGGTFVSSITQSQNATELNQERINELWNAENDGRAGVLLRQNLVRELRIWQPELVLVQNPDPQSDSGAEKILQEAVLDAVQLAGDPLAFSEQATDSGLSAWKTPEVLGVTGPELDADWQLSTNQTVPLLQGTLRLAAQDARRMINPDTIAPKLEKVRLKRITQTAGTGSDANYPANALSGLRPSGSKPRTADKLAALAASIRLIPHENQREYRNFWSEDEKRLESQIRLTNNTLAMINQPTGIFQNNPVQLVSYVGRLVNDLNENQAVGVLEELSAQFRRNGQPELAAELDYLVFNQYESQPGSDQAAFRLIQYFCSLEVQTSEKSRTPFIPPDTAYQTAQSRAQLATLFCAQLHAVKPSVYEKGQTRRIIASLERRTEQGTGRSWYASAANSGFYDAATILAAKAESWILQRDGAPVLPIIHATRTDRAPQLDGVLDEPVWTQSKPVLLTGAASAFRNSTSVRFAWDGRFLYLGAEVPRQPGFIYTPNKQPRTWDEDISASDQLSLILDTDRDYYVAFRLASDYNGRPNDSCGENRGWNPRWFIASKVNPASWTLEWAIPWSELLPEPPNPNQICAVQLFRHICGWGTQSIPRLDKNLTAQENQNWGLLLLEP